MKSPVLAQLEFQHSFRSRNFCTRWHYAIWHHVAPVSAVFRCHLGFVLEQQRIGLLPHPQQRFLVG
jgi:hypothetical protein